VPSERRLRAVERRSPLSSDFRELVRAGHAYRERRVGLEIGQLEWFVR